VPTTLFFLFMTYVKRYFLGFNTLGNGKQFPQYWKNDPEEGGKKPFEAEF
jgi:hypothetical protein